MGKDLRGKELGRGISQREGGFELVGFGFGESIINY